VKVTFWGVRGSIPTPQRENLGFGGETACVTIEAEGARIVLDAGSGVRLLGDRITAQEPVEILLSHFHWDHVQGLPYFAPLYKPGTIRFHAQVAAEQLHANLAKQMATPFFPLEFDAASAGKEFSQFAWYVPFTIGPFRITPFPLHHPQDCTGFRVECGGRVIVYATDHEHGDAEKDAVLLRYAKGADILIADAQYTPVEYAQRKGFGHSTWLDAAQLAEAAQVGRLVLFHHDPRHSDEMLRQIVTEARTVFTRTEAARERTTLTADGSLGERADGMEFGLKDHPVRVLLVDDQRMVGEAVRRMLMGHTPEIEFRFCSDAAAAIAMANEFGPTLILQDLIMPGVEGLDMVRAFRANAATAPVPIIVLSSKEEAATKAESFAAGANDYIVKLPDKIELLARIEHHSAAFVNRLQRDEAYEKLSMLLEQVSKEKQKSETLLLNILPEAVASELKESGNVRAMGFDVAGVLFADFCNFTALSHTMTADELVSELNECFTAFDRITMAHGVEKLKTIGDGYLCVSGVPEPRGDALMALARVGLEVRDYIAARRSEKTAAGVPYWDVRVGLHCGPLVAGVVGLRKFAYDVWGDTVNVASRMESAGAPGRVNISSEFRAQLPESAMCEARGLIAVKGNGEVEMFFLDSL